LLGRSGGRTRARSNRALTMSDLYSKVARSIFTPDALARHEGLEANYAEDCKKFAAMTDEQLAETVAYFLHHCERPRWSRGEPVYDAVMWHNLIPEMMRRLRD